VRPAAYMEIRNFYTMTVYEKGAELVRMQHTLLGAQAFRAGMDLYFERHDGQAVTTDDFVQAMQDASGIEAGAGIVPVEREAGGRKSAAALGESGSTSSDPRCCAISTVPVLA